MDHQEKHLWKSEMSVRHEKQADVKCGIGEGRTPQAERTEVLCAPRWTKRQGEGMKEN